MADNTPEGIELQTKSKKSYYDQCVTKCIAPTKNFTWLSLYSCYNYDKQ